MQKRTTRHPAGMTLIELMFAIVVLAIALAATLAASQTGHVADQTAYDRTRSTEAAQRLMEEALALPTDAILMLNGNAAITEGYLGKIEVVSRDISMVEVRVAVLRPTADVSAEAAADLTMAEFWALPSTSLSRTRLVSLKVDGL